MTYKRNNEEKTPDLKQSNLSHFVLKNPYFSKAPLVAPIATTVPLLY
jgi:hypothetical protein